MLYNSVKPFGSEQ